MTTANSAALSETTSWKLQSYIDFDYLDTDLDGLRFTQGLVWNGDSQQWISTWQYGMARLNTDFTFLQTTGTIDLTTFEVTTGIPAELAAMGLDHIGDIDYYDGTLYVALDSAEGDYQTGYIALFNASDLSYTGTLYEFVGAPTNEHDDVASWVAVDGEAGIGYGKEWQSGNTINMYDLDDWSFEGTLEMDQALKSIQGAKVLDGMMYMASDNDTRSIYSVDLDSGHVEELFQLPGAEDAETEVEGIEAKLNKDGNVELTIELIIDPEGDIYADAYTRLFTYVLDGTSNPDAELHHTWTVTTSSDSTNADDMALTLREAIAKADAGDTIAFNAALAGETITLADAELLLSQDITIEGDIDGDGDADITLDGAASTPVIHVSGGKVILDGLLLTSGDGTDAGNLVVDDGATVEFSHGATYLGTAADDTVDGTNTFDAIRAGAGNDIVQAKSGDDQLYGEGGNDALNGGAGKDTLSGGKGSDDLWGNGGSDALSGGAGADRIYGGSGRDMLSGDAGADVFVFAAGDTSDKGWQADTIMDMHGQAGDRIDLSLFDANENRKGNQSFHFVGTDHFSGHAAELRYATTDSGIRVYGDTDGDENADFVLYLEGASTLKETFFSL